MKKAFSIFCSLVLIALTFTASAQKKELKRLLGTWELDGMIQYGDTAFMRTNLDTTRFINQYIEKNRVARGLDRVSSRDSAMIADGVLKRIDGMSQTRLIFEKDSLYRNQSSKESENSFGKYWVENSQTLFIQDTRSGNMQRWEMELTKETLKMTYLEQDMIFLMKKIED